MEYAGNYSRPAAHAAAEKPSPPTAGEKDDFIEVGDDKGLRKAWPMTLFLALLAAAVGML